MEREALKEIWEKLKYKENEWIFLYEVDSILLNGGRGIYPDWRHMKFMLSGGTIYIRHGYVEPYGARISGLMSQSYDKESLYFALGEDGIHVEKNDMYGWFRQPKPGDVLHISSSESMSVEGYIKELSRNINGVIIKLWYPINIPRDARLSFYDPAFLSDKENCIHSAVYPGIYMHFIPNPGKEHKKYGVFHEIIKVKSIESIHLKVKSQDNNKTFKLN